MGGITPLDCYWYEGLSWPEYEAIVESWEGHAFRHTLDRGTLEVFLREYCEQRIKVMIGLVVHFVSSQLRIPIRSGGSPILYSEMKRCALNPDEVYHVANERFVRGEDCPGLHQYPPDLAVEVAIPASKIDRMKIYPLFCVPEVWRYADSRLEFLALRGEYVPIERSLAFPLLTPDDVMQFVAMRDSVSDTVVMQRIVRWVRQRKRSERKSADTRDL
jgi:Uma2 family endonuclease